MRGENMRGYIAAIEDNPDDQMLLARAIKKSDQSPNLLLLNDGEEAIEYFSELRKLPDLILLDISLPKFDGIEVLLSIKKSRHYRNVPVVMMTTSSMRRDIHQAYTAGANSYIVKDQGLANWNRELNSALNYWLEVNKTINSCDVT